MSQSPNDTPKLRLSWSKCNVFLRCRMRYKWCYKHNLVPKEKAWPLSVGVLVHHMLFLENKGELDKWGVPEFLQWSQLEFPDMTPDQVERLVLEAGDLVMGYLQSQKQEGIKVISPEVHMEKDFGSFILYSRLDAIAQTPDQRVWRMEYKTTARMDSMYLQGLRKGLQTGIAHWLADELLPQRINGTLFGLLVKTKIPQYAIMPYTREKWVQEYAEKCVKGIAQSIANGDLYPSLDCTFGYNKCEYMPLCSTNGSEEAQRAFFTQRKEVPRDTVLTIDNSDNG